MAEPPNPALTLALLWGTHTRTGRSGLTVKSIVECAVQLADEEGLSQLSMRRVADKLKVGTMTLYTHVPGKETLTELMVDHVHQGLYPHPDHAAQQGGWRQGLLFIAQKNWELLTRHPWLLERTGSRPVLGPHLTLKYETELRALDQTGLTDLEMDLVLQLVLTHVEGSARMHLGGLDIHKDSGMTDAEWWTVQAPLLERVMDGRQFPVASRVGQAAGEAFGAASSPEHHLNFGLSRILDGVEMLLSERQNP